MSRSSFASNNKPLLDIIEAIYKNRHLIAAAYDERGIAITEGDLDRVNLLVDSELLKHEDSRISLRRDFRALFDRPLKKHEFFAANTNFDTIMTEIHQHILALNEIDPQDYAGRAEKLSLIHERIHDDIYGVFDLAVRQLQYKTEENFGLLSLSKSKQEENKEYINSISLILANYNNVEHIFQEDIYQDEPSISDAIVYLKIRCIALIDNLKSIDAKLREFMFKQRKIEKEARTIRAVIRHFEQTPNFIAQGSESDFFRLAQSIKITPFAINFIPDLTDSNAEHDFAPLILKAQKTISAMQVNPKTKQESTAANEEGMKRVAEVTPKIVTDIIAMLTDVFERKKAVSLLSYWGQNKGQFACSFDELIDHALDYLTLNPVFGGRPLSHYIRFQLSIEDHPVFSGNKYLRDIVVFPADFTLAQINDPACQITD